MDERKNNFNSLIRFFSPAWFAVVMGTGGLANALFIIGGASSFFKVLAIILACINIIMFILFLVPWVARWFKHFDQLQKDLKNPVMSNFFVTMPVGGIIVAINVIIMGKSYFSMAFLLGLGTAIWAIAAALILTFGVFVMYNMMTMESIGPDATNFSWFITPVASIVLPMLGNMLVMMYLQQNMNLAKFVHLVDLCFMGIGLFLFLILSAIVLNRLINHPIPHAMATPTFWIILGPIGVGTISLMGIADTSKALGLIASTDTLKLIALMLWGVGIWAIAITIAVTVRYIRKGGIPFSLSWWAFIFPTAVYTISTYSIYQYINVSVVQGYAILLLALTSALWIGTFLKTVTGIKNGKLIFPINK